MFVFSFLFVGEGGCTKRVLTQMVIIKKKNPQIINAGEGMERRETFYTVHGNVNWYSHCGEQYGGGLKN